MVKQYNDQFDEDGILKDGQRVRVPLMMMDCMKGAVPLSVVSRQGVFTDEMRAAQDTRQDAYKKRMGDAWRTPDAPPQPVETKTYKDRMSNAWRNP